MLRLIRKAFADNITIVMCRQRYRITKNNCDENGKKLKREQYKLKEEVKWFRSVVQKVKNTYFFSQSIRIGVVAINFTCISDT